MNKLLAYMNQKGYSEQVIAVALGIPLDHFDELLTSMEFSLSQIRQLVIILGMTTQDYLDIFFTV